MRAFNPAGHNGLPINTTTRQLFDAGVHAPIAAQQYPTMGQDFEAGEPVILPVTGVIDTTEQTGVMPGGGLSTPIEQIEGYTEPDADAMAALGSLSIGQPGVNE